MSKKKEFTEEFLYSLFNDICVGSSSLSFKGEDLFIKHPTVSDFAIFEHNKSKKINKLIEAGGQTQKEVIENMKNNGDWDEKAEIEIKKLESELYSLNVYKKTQINKAKIQAVRIKIGRAIKGIEALKLKLENSIPYEGVDVMVGKRCNIDFLLESLYVDESCTRKFYSKDSDDTLCDSDLEILFSAYVSFKNDFDNDVIQYLVVSDFFKPYFAWCDSCLEFFHTPAKNLTQYQVFLLYFGGIFKSVFENHSSEMPNEICNNPEAILEFVEAQHSKVEQVNRDEKKLDKHGNLVFSTKFGSSQEEMESANGVGDFADFKTLIGEGGSLTGEELAKKVVK